MQLKKDLHKTSDKIIDKAIAKTEKIIEITNLTKTYGTTTVVDDISLGIKRGEFVTLLGPSGCGKTTTLRMIAGFEKPTEGKVFLEGADVTELPPHLRKVNTVFQRYALFPHLNVFNNIAFGLKLKKIPCGVVEKRGKTIEKFRHFTKAEIQEKVTRALKLVDLEDYGRRDTASLSGGQQQRVAIARALVNEPQVLLLDEPLGALDLKMRKEMQLELMRMHKDLKITFIYVTHDQEEALTMSDTVVVMNNGEIQQIGTPQQIYDEPSNAFVADFIGESNILSGVMIEDYKVKFTNSVFTCLDKGFDKFEPVDLVIRPEDIELVAAADKRAQLTGVVTSSVFKGDYYEMQILANQYEFSVQVTNGKPHGETVGLAIAPNSIHIMKKQRIFNEVKTEITGENTVRIEGGDFVYNQEGFTKGDRVKARFPFNKVDLTDYKDEGIIGGKVVSALYKGTYYQVIVATDQGDYDIFVDTKYEYNIGDEVGINIPAEYITLEHMTEDEIKEEDSND